MPRTVWVIIAVLIVTAALVFGLQGQGQLWPSIWVVVLGLALIVTLLAVSRSNEEFLSYFLFALCGGALGWVVGILATPGSAQEEKVFGEYKAAITAFVSGFAVTKINDVWKMLTADTSPLLLQARVLSRVLIFLGVFFLLVAQQYNSRQNAPGKVIVAAEIARGGQTVVQTQGPVTVVFNDKVTLKGAAAAPDLDVDWSIPLDSDFAKAVDFKAPVISIPATLPDAVEDGAKFEATATSRWNRAKTAKLAIVLSRPKTAPAAAPVPAVEAPK